MFLSFDLRFCLRTNRGNLLPALVIMEVVVLISGADCPIFFFSLLFFFCQTFFSENYFTNLHGSGKRKVPEEF